jgi:nitrate/TMAO reductase-like tetraheme cytochrome c subunit
LSIIRRFSRESLIAWLAGFCSALVFVWLGASAVLGTSRDAFCVSCHEMSAAGRQLDTSSHGKNRSGRMAQCADCHIAPGVGGLVKAKWKGLGIAAVHFFQRSRVTGEQWELRRLELRKDLERQLPQESCVCCHDRSRMKPSTREAEIAHKVITPNMRCLDCHSVEGLGRLVHN